MPDKLQQSHNQILFDHYDSKGPYKLGPYSSFSWRNDAKHILFTLARYKFVAKMLEGKQSVLEIGCGDGIGSAILLQSVGQLHATDLEQVVINYNDVPDDLRDRLSFSAHDITRTPLNKRFDAALSIDVIEHVDPSEEHLYMENVVSSLNDHAIFVVGTPNIEADKHASENSREGHINLKSGATLRNTMAKYFHNVLMFSMNDEVVHTGYQPMAHFLFAVGIGVKSQ